MKNILEFERGFLAETPDEYALAMHRILSQYGKYDEIIYKNPNI